MAKIHLRGGHSIEVSQEKAKEINRDWIDKVLPEMVELETESFKSSEIKGIEGVGVSIKDDRHSLDNPRTKEEASFAQKSETVTQPSSTDKLDPATCPHNPKDPENSYCTACATWLDGEPEPIATESPFTVEQLTAVFTENGVNR